MKSHGTCSSCGFGRPVGFLRLTLSIVDSLRKLSGTPIALQAKLPGALYRRKTIISPWIASFAILAWLSGLTKLRRDTPVGSVQSSTDLRRFGSVNEPAKLAQ